MASLGLLLAGLGRRAQLRPRAKAAQLLAFGLFAGLLSAVGSSVGFAQPNRSLGYDANSNITAQTSIRAECCRPCS